MEPNAAASPSRFRLLRFRMAGATPSTRAAAALGALAGVFVAGVAVEWIAGLSIAMPLLIGPIGASAVLAFAVPSSPLAQPWAVIGGNLISAIVGLLVASQVEGVALAGGLAVGGAIVAMTLTRSLHPPGGAMALTAVLMHDAGVGGWAVPLLPIAINSVALVAVAWAFHRLQGRSYPHRPEPARSDLFHPDDIRAAVKEMGETFDVTHRDLEAIFARAETHRAARAAPRKRRRQAARRT